MMVTLNVKTILQGQDAKLQLVTEFINFVIVPTIVFSIGKIFIDRVVGFSDQLFLRRHAGLLRCLQQNFRLLIWDSSYI
jgi:ACR3 family arsenite efflux pump ArsB